MRCMMGASSRLSRRPGVTNWLLVARGLRFTVQKTVDAVVVRGEVQSWLALLAGCGFGIGCRFNACVCIALDDKHMTCARVTSIPLAMNKRRVDNSEVARSVDLGIEADGNLLQINLQATRDHGHSDCYGNDNAASTASSLHHATALRDAAAHRRPLGPHRALRRHRAVEYLATPVLTPEEGLAKFLHYTQSRNEKYSALALELTYVHREAQPMANVETRRISVINCFIKAITEQQIRVQLHHKEPKNIEEVIKAAEKELLDMHEEAITKVQVRMTPFTDPPATPAQQPSQDQRLQQLTSMQSPLHFSSAFYQVSVTC
ncbi:unnamed protein product [Sphagnum balticum]